jgi:hypothetical protein
VISNPEVGLDTENSHWTDASDGEKPEERVTLRYVRPPGLPMWLGADPGGVLASLSVSRATGGTVFHVTDEQWEALVAAVGGWPEEAAESATAQDVVAELGRPSRGQGFSVDPQVRRAVELHAMDMAIAHYVKEGWTGVKDVSRTQSYDLHCSKPGAPDLHVEVKGTTSDGSTVLLTPNEVEHARASFPNVALFVVAQIRVTPRDAGEVTVQGGVASEYQRWRVDDGTLHAVGYSHSPATPTTRQPTPPE